MERTRSLYLAALTIGAALMLAAPVHAQAWHYAAYQPAEVATPEANFAISGFSDYGMSFVGQYRFTADKRTQLWADVGLATPSGNSTLFLVGIAGGWNVVKPTADKPIDVMPTLGVYGAFGGDIGYVRVPIGVDVGHEFKLDNGHSIDAFAFPRISIDICTTTCSGTHGNLNFDVGASYDFTKAMAGRAAFTFGGVGDGSSEVGFGVSLAIKTGRSEAAPATKK